jgi:chromate transporter
MEGKNMDEPVRPAAATKHPGTLLEVLGVQLRLGLTSFGGPIAHLGYYREEFVTRRRWLDEQAFADLVALCQFLPGPASSQVSIAVGISRAGLLGGIVAWAGFTLPSALAMIAFAYGISTFSEALHSGWLHGLKVVAVAVVAQAVWGMARTLAPDRRRMTLAVAACLLVLAWPTGLGQIAAIALGGLAGWRFLPAAVDGAPSHTQFFVSRRTGIVAWALFFGLLALLPLLRGLSPVLAVLDGFYRAGSLVFGGGHVVLPLLQAQVVPTGWVSNDLFLAGYGAAQAVPGPLFTFAAYLGTVLTVPSAHWPAGWLGGLVALVAIFLPAFLLVVGALPFWEALRHRVGIQSALRGVNAAVVGVLLAALYHPIWTSAIRGGADFGLALAAFLLLTFWKAPPWLVVGLCALGGGALAALT